MPATARIVPSPIHFLRLDDAVPVPPIFLSRKHAMLAAWMLFKIACPQARCHAWQVEENA
jgi:hypothetical protein